MEKLSTQTFDSIEEMNKFERLQWENFINLEYENDFEEYDNGYRIDTWLWNDTYIKNIIAFPGDTPIEAVFIENEIQPIIDGADSDFSLIELSETTPLQKKLQNDFKKWCDIQETFEKDV